MKNLKFKVSLAILLVIMLIGMCFAGNEFSDVERTKYELAVKALHELEVVDSRYSSDGNYYPNNVVTRAEMMKALISAYGIELAANGAKDDNIFNDVPSSYWASGYINLAYDWDFLIESAGTNFRPDATITYSEAITYCLRVLGYGNEIDSKGSWPANYIAKAQDLKLLKDIEFNSYNDGLRRGNFALLLWNVMNTSVWKIIGNTSEGVVAGSTVTLLEAKHSDKIDDIEELMQVKTLEFENPVINLELGDREYLDLAITPSYATEKITYSSSDKTYVTVDSNGKVKAVKAGGIATITAKTESGKTTICKVVVPKSVVSKMVLGTSLDKNSLNSDDVWVSSDESVVTFEGEKYTAKKLGKCTLTAYLKDNPNILTAKVEVEVIETLGSMSIEVKGGENYTLEVGNEIDLEAEIISNVENNDGSKYKLTWKSSNSNIVTVKGNNRKAKLTAKNPGTCDIVVSHDGMKTTIKINVIDSDASIEYDDVKEDDWFEESVKYVTNNNLMNGMGDNKFSPSSNMTRGMIVTVLYRMSESSYNGKSTFVDVKESEYYSAAVAWAAENGIVNGIGNNKFEPNAEITREQLIVILYRYAKAMKIDVSVGESTNILSYDDFNEIAEYSIPAFQWGSGKGIISGRTSTTLSPKGTASRAEVATMLMSFIED